MNKQNQKKFASCKQVLVVTALCNITVNDFGTMKCA